MPTSPGFAAVRSRALGSRGRRPNRDGLIGCLKKMAQARNFAHSQRHWHRSGLGSEGFLGDGNEGLARF
jgi:hypothetical protein